LGVCLTGESWKAATELPIVLGEVGRACQDAVIKHVSPHSFRHSYRAWLEELGTPVTVQQRAMHHADIRVTMNYGDAVGEALPEATAKVAARAIPQ